MDDVEIDLGQEHVTIQRRYEALGALNDLISLLLFGFWFLIGSVFFLTSLT